MSVLLNKTMSRNGGTLICQLLEGHNEIFFPPFYFDAAIKNPKCWPFSGFSEIAKEDFVRSMLAKISYWEGREWHIALNKSIFEDTELNLKEVEIEKFTDIFLHDSITSDRLDKAFTSFMEMLLASYKHDYDSAMRLSKYFVIDADHSFNCGISEALTNFRDIRFFQVIRNVYDVVASRKNMLLHQAKKFGNPVDFTLREEVIMAEVSRWLLSVEAAYNHDKSAQGKSITLQFESLHRERESVMQQMAEFLNISFASSLLVEGLSEVESINQKNSKFMSSSSLLHITKGKSSTVIGSSLETLNEIEFASVKKTLGNFSFEWPMISDILEFHTFLQHFLQKHKITLEDNFIIRTAKSLENPREKMEFYSLFNYGRANVNEAFIPHD